MMQSVRHRDHFGLSILSKPNLTSHYPPLRLLAKQTLLPAAPTIHQSLKACSVAIQPTIMSFRVMVIYPNAPSKHSVRQSLISGDFKRKQIQQSTSLKEAKSHPARVSIFFIIISWISKALSGLGTTFGSTFQTGHHDCTVKKAEQISSCSVLGLWRGCGSKRPGPSTLPVLPGWDVWLLAWLQTLSFIPDNHLLLLIQHKTSVLQRS